MVFYINMHFISLPSLPSSSSATWPDPEFPPLSPILHPLRLEFFKIFQKAERNSTREQHYSLKLLPAHLETRWLWHPCESLSDGIAAGKISQLAASLPTAERRRALVSQCVLKTTVANRKAAQSVAAAEASHLQPLSLPAHFFLSEQELELTAIFKRFIYWKVITAIHVDKTISCSVYEMRKYWK